MNYGELTFTEHKNEYGGKYFTSEWEGSGLVQFSRELLQEFLPNTIDFNGIIFQVPQHTIRVVNSGYNPLIDAWDICRYDSIADKMFYHYIIILNHTIRLGIWLIFVLNQIGVAHTPEGQHYHVKHIVGVRCF